MSGSCPLRRSRRVSTRLDACSHDPGERSAGPGSGRLAMSPEPTPARAGSSPVPGAGWGDGVYMEACPAEGAAQGSPVGYFLVSDAAMDRMFVWVHLDGSTVFEVF